MKTGRYVWGVEPAPKWFYERREWWLKHAVRARMPFTDATSDGLWRRAHEPAMCGATPPDGVWSSIGNGWMPQHDRWLGERLREQGDADNCAHIPPCPECERLADAAGLEAGRERW